MDGIGQEAEGSGHHAVISILQAHTRRPPLLGAFQPPTALHVRFKICFLEPYDIPVELVTRKLSLRKGLYPTQTSARVSAEIVLDCFQGDKHLLRCSIRLSRLVAITYRVQQRRVLASKFQYFWSPHWMNCEWSDGLALIPESSFTVTSRRPAEPRLGPLRRRCRSAQQATPPAGLLPLGTRQGP